MLKLESATPGARIFYEESDVDPRPLRSALYSVPIRLRSRTVRAVAVKDGMTMARVTNFFLHQQVLALGFRV
jgi:hypothetical protein